MGLVEYAKNELELLKKGKNNEEAAELQNLANKDILEIIEVFSKQGHSGFSAGYVISILNRLLNCKPITPLTGEEDEWNIISDHIKQNKRCSSVFMNDGVAEDIDAITISDNGGITWFQSGRFRKNITFPYYPPNNPEKVYIEYTEEVPHGFTSDKYDIITDDEERIKNLYERSRREFDEAYLNVES